MTTATPRLWWTIEVPGTESIEFFGTRAEADLVRVRRGLFENVPGSMRPSTEDEAHLGHDSLVWYFEHGFLLDDRELEAIGS